jgi:hypothetical protein
MLLRPEHDLQRSVCLSFPLFLRPVLPKIGDELREMGISEIEEQSSLFLSSASPPPGISFFTNSLE